jgi:hypothetical protein
MLLRPRQSKYYISSESWTKAPAWAFEIPLTAIQGSEPQTIRLRYETGARTRKYRELRVPSAYLQANLSRLFVREDHGTVSLFLSAEPNRLFVEQRGKHGVQFAQFAV